MEILFFEGCPHHAAARRLVEAVAEELGIRVRVQMVDVADAAAAERHRFLGSPTVRVDGRDVEPGADERDDVALSCRVYATSEGRVGQPDGEWIRTALRRAASQTGGADVDGSTMQG